MTLLLLADARSAGAFSIERRPGSVVARIGAAQRFDGPLRVSLYHQVLAQWIGGTLWIGPLEPERAAETLWFRGGVARFLARELAFQFGLITPVERRDEIEHLIEIALLSKLRDRPGLALATEGAGDDEAALVVARSALYATWLDAELRARTGKGGLDVLMRDLMQRALGGEAAMSTDAWLGAVRDAAGEPAVAAFRAQVEGREIAVLPADVLGPCFRPARRRYEQFALGFVEERKESGRFVTAVDAAGPAARAGLAVGDAITRLVAAEGRTDQDVEIEIERGGKAKRIVYRPVGASVEGPGYRRDAAVPDARCSERR
jgi:predicted metalloprotease with PDZ domain